MASRSPVVTSPSQFPSHPPSRKLRARDDTAKNRASTLKDYRLDELDLPSPYCKLRVGPIKSSAKVDEAMTSPSSAQAKREIKDENDLIAEL